VDLVKKLENRLEGSIRAAIITKRYVRDKEFIIILKNKKLFRFSNIYISERFRYNNSIKIYNRNKSNRFRVFYIKTCNLLYKRSL
jgi:hypothetical protein